MFGSHLSIAGGMENALLAAEKLRLGTVQVFTKNQQQWAAKPLDPAAVKVFRDHAERLGFHQIVAHDSYLINLAAVDATLWEKSVDAFREEMHRCDELGIAYLVTHPGAHCGSGEACGIARVIEGMNRILNADETGKVTVCLETTAGQGSCLGCTFEHLAEMIRGIHRQDRVAVCVDTCHILAAGYDITTAAGMKKTLDDMDRAFGLERVKVWHLNDSKKALGTRVDRHEHLGRGFVGPEAFAVICQDPRFANVPKILETPKDKAPDGRDWDEVNLELLRGFASGKMMQVQVFAAELQPAPNKATAKKQPAGKSTTTAPKTRTRAKK